MSAPDRLRLDQAAWPLVRRFAVDFVVRHPGGLALSSLLMVIAAAATGCYPLLIERSYAMFEGGAPAMLFLVPLAIIGLTAVKGASVYGQSVVTAALVETVLADVRQAMFARLTRADFARLQGDGAGALTARFLLDIDLVRIAVSRVLTNLLRDVLTVVFLVGSMLWLDWALSLVFVAIYPLAALPVTRLGKRLRGVAKATQAQVGGMTALIRESLAGARLVKTYGLEEYETARGQAAFEANFQLNADAARKRALLEPILEVLGGVVVAGVIAFAGWRIAEGQGSAGAFTGFLGALMMAAQPVRAIGTLNTVLQEGLAAVQRIFALLDEAPKVAEKPAALPLSRVGGEVRFENVVFHYRDDFPALNGVSFTVKPGRTVALVGRSGSGKSSIFNLIPRLYDVSGGAVRIDGVDVRDVTLDSLRRQIALVSQDSILFDDTVAANIALGKAAGASRDEIVAAAQAAAADEFIRALPQGYDTPVGHGGGRLSGGQRQRVALARAFLKDAPILLLDEATSALDAESERLIQAALGRLTHGRTTLVAAHRLSTVRHADQILVLDAGRIVESGTHDGLLAQDGLYARLLRLQNFQE